jgi:hypothetical protein
MSDTVDLKEFILAILDEKDKALIAALVAVKEENRKTEQQAEKRFDLLNELRSGVATTEQVEALEKVVHALTDRINRTDGKSDGLNASWVLFLGIAGLASIVIGAIVAFR